MPRFKGSCGCYNKQDARELGLAPAIVWNDMTDRAEHFDMNPMWYDQKDASDRLGIPERSMNRAVEKLVDAGRISKKKGYRPGTTISTTWVTILEEPVGGSRNDDLAVPRNDDLAVPILNDTKEKETELEEPQNEVHMLPSALYSKLRSAFPGSSNDMRKKKIEAVEKLQNEYELSDDTILEGVREIAKHPTYTFKDGTEFTETLSSLLLGDLDRTANKLLKKAEAGRVKEEKKKKKISRSQALLNSGVC